jgi:hypothetical protein
MSDSFPPEIPPAAPQYSPQISPPSHGNLFLAVIGGLVAAIVGAVLWAVITAATQFQIGFMAVGVGFLVGGAVWALGHGQTPVFGVVGAVCALLGCVLGNVLTACYFIGSSEGMGTVETLQGVIAAGNLVNLITATFEGMDLLFYGIAVYEGFKLSFRPGQ